MLEIIIRNPHISRKELAQQLGLHESTVKRRLEYMVVNRIIQRVGPDKGGCWRVVDKPNEQ